MGKPLAKSILGKLLDSEAKKLTKLQEKSDNLGKEMLKYQSEYVVAAKKGNTDDVVLRKMADKGFKYEKLAFEAVDKLNEYKDFLTKKYIYKRV
jgi:hypothetical protein